jgi:hypothetical protein
MPSAKKPTRSATRPRPKATPSARPGPDPEVAAFLDKLDHPRKRDIEAVRRIILATSPTIREGIKWNGPSFRTSEWFATFFLRAQSRVQIVFHTGAKVKDHATNGVKIADPLGLCEWLAKERCLVTVGQGPEIQQNRAALQAIVRAWIRQLG